MIEEKPKQLEEVITLLIIQEKAEAQRNQRRMNRIKSLCAEYQELTGNYYRFPTPDA